MFRCKFVNAVDESSFDDFLSLSEIQPSSKKKALLGHLPKENAGHVERALNAQGITVLNARLAWT